MLTKIEKSNIKCTILTILVISPLFLVLIINTSYLTVENIQNKHHSMKTPNLSTDEITIDKPENKTYTAPMSGYYPATYGFEDDIANNNPKGWSYYELGGRGDIFVKEDMANHDKIIQFQDTGTSGGLIMEQFFNEGNQPNGSVEFWVRTDDAWKRFVLADLRLDPTPLTSSICFLQIHEYKFQYWDTSTYYDLGKGALSNQWYHIRIDFESSLGGYQNLEQQKWQIYIDGVKFGPYNYNNALNNAGWLRFESDPTDLNFNSYIDAIGYSWDNDYLMGDNAREGLLLSYQNSTALEWTGYSLDGLANNTISGNTTIPMPSDGSHAIQVFGNSSSGIKYTSEKRWFTINRTIQLLINTPENTTYTSPMSGYYPATYGFEEDSVNTNPKGWSFYEGGTRGDVFVNSSLANHNNIAQFKATGSSVGFIMEQFFKDGNQPNGSVELWVRTDDASKRFIFADLRLDPTPLTSSICFLQINGNKFQYWDTSTYYDLGKAAASNVWYHIRVDFECTLGNYQSLGQYKWQIYIDGVKFGPYDYNNDVSNAGWLRFESNPSVSNFNSYIDAIGYSWDKNYLIGDNKREGLLLDFYNSAPFEWAGYSLDGQANKTILGNTTIPMPLDGLHSIQVFSNSSVGNNYNSEKKWFTINRTIQLSINTPENKTYTTPMSGYYPATYGFEEDAVNSNPQGWSFYEGGTRGDVFVNSSLANHNNIAQFKATGSSVGFIMEQFFKDGNQPNGSVELWVRTDDASKRFIFADLRLDPTPLTSSICFLQINGNKFQYWDTSTYYDLGKAAASNVWYHIRVDFECTLGNYQSLGQYKWQIYIDGVKFGPYDYNNDVSNAGWLRFESNPSVSNFNSYIDAIGYSWDSNYALGNNKNEGLLLSYTNSTALKWQGYSLDGQSNKTILGNTTIPMPMNGLHSIQMFGNDSLGRNYLSIVRRFTCNVPDISKPQFTAKTYDSDIFQGEYVSFTLKILDDYPDSYRIYRNGTLVRDSSSYTNNVFIPTFNELNWTAGTLEYTIEANDTSGNSNSTTITIMISQRPGYDFIKPNIITIILQEGLDIEFSAKQAGFLNVSQQVPEFNAGLVEARFHGYEITPLKYYNFTVFNLTLGEDESIINYVFIRFYYDPAQVEDETDLYLMHYVWSYENLMWVWEAETAIVTNADLNYIEWNTTDLSEFWLAEIRAPPGQEKKDDDDGDSTESSILVFFAKNMIIIVILSAIGVTIPSLYVAKSKKKKSALKEKSIGAVKSFDLAARAKEKKAALEKVTWKSEEAEPKKTKLEAKKIESTKLVAIELPKKKLKSKPETKPQENSEQEAKLKAKEVEETEKELELKEKLDICPVHKGTIEGVSYICPKCHAKYCLKCAKTLMENREGCWVCETAINAITDNQESIKKDATNTTVREKSKDLAEPNDNEYFLKLIQGDDGADRFDILKGYDFTVISKEFEEKVKQMDWDEEEKQKFLAEMISLTPMERERILDDMFRNEAELRKKKDKSPK